jgi:hypothetical protein
MFKTTACVSRTVRSSRTTSTTGWRERWLLIQFATRIRSVPGAGVNGANGSGVADFNVELWDFLEGFLAEGLLSELALAVIQELAQERHSEEWLIIRVAWSVGQVVGRLAALLFILLHPEHAKNNSYGWSEKRFKVVLCYWNHVPKHLNSEPMQWLIVSSLTIHHTYCLDNKCDEEEEEEEEEDDDTEHIAFLAAR